VHSGYWLMANTVLTGLIGVLFWAVAARLMSQTALGAGATVISLITLLSNIGQVNLSYSLPVLLPMAGRRRRQLLRRGLLLAIGVTLMVCVGYFLLFASNLPLQLTAPLIGFLIFCALLWTIFVVEDGALIGLRMAWLVPVSNAVFGLAKLGVLLLLFEGLRVPERIDPSVLMVTAWFVPLLAIIPVVVAAALRQASRQEGVDLERLPDLREFLAWDYVGGVAYQLALSMSFFVGVTVGPEAAAAFVAAWTVAQVADLATNNLTAPMGVAVAESHDAGKTEAEVEIAQRLIVLVPFGVAAAIVLAPYLILIFGPDYVTEAVPILRMLMVALLFKAAATYSMWGLRGRGRAREVAAIQVLLAVTTVGAGFLLTEQLQAQAYAVGFLLGSAAAGMLGVLMLRRAWLSADTT